ncbi:lymphokine-activated killer T-cell-originated protein kinase [Prorops nasuta]|uniref:lymphokine-activated killer T-cell-originated protein kinase n=1 Tax=Prorops nasuta TaxID=863751 RepID=UPI0034D005B4
MTEFKTPTSQKFRKKIVDNTNLQTPIKIPASPFLQQIGYGCGVNVYMFERSPKVGFIRSPWAIKKRNRKAPKTDKTYSERIRIEADILKKLNHPNVVGFRAFMDAPNDDPCLAMEKLDASLGNIIEEKFENAEDPFAAYYILKVGYEVAKGLEYLHNTAHILHGDIKSYNILVSKDFSTVKLCDFGVSLPLNDKLVLDDSNGEFCYIGTECWNAPEIIFGDGEVTDKADIWSYGLVLWEMIALSAPRIETEDSMMEESFNTLNEKENQVYNISMNESFDDFPKEKFATRPPLPAIDLGPEYDTVLQTFFICTESKYENRPSAKGLVKFFEEYVYKNKQTKPL